ncbi:A24 family peptidase (plasmid) [Photobacterium sp. DA100]|uniref:A24 family peptidase n=1 Tax=Photobacterium sp. DA100 TaxID=3027472 RepID=UPI00247A0348|nr:A24 family peptidase [Photobacterium sp. DA100]WEM45628.1 A24 family peptidase [Photobacterium sp. DA100]
MSLPIIILVFYAALYDIKYSKIPNYLVLSIVVIGTIQLTYNSDITSSISAAPIFFAISGIFVGLSICIILFYIGLFGAGDAKLLASLGIFFGPSNIIILIAVAVGFAGLLSLSRLSCYGELTPMLSRWCQSIKLGCYLKPEANTTASSAVPMGGAILLATVFCEFYLF